MSGAKMRDDEFDIDTSLVVRLVAAQFPRWADLPVVKVRSAGTDNAMYRLGNTMVVRLPRLPRAARQVGAEQRRLPYLAPHLPLAVPEILGRGVPGEGYELPWSVCRRLDGENAYDGAHRGPGAGGGRAGPFRVDPAAARHLRTPLIVRGSARAERDRP